MTLRGLGLAALFAVCAVNSAHALVHDSPAEFASIIAQQGTTATSGVIDASRSNINNVFDGVSTTFFSVGFGGQVAFTITPGNRITGGTAIETTFAAAVGHMEAIEVFLGTAADPYANSIGYLLNADANFFVNGTTGPGVEDTSALADLSAAAIPGSNGGTFTILNVTGEFDTIAFRDASGVNTDGEGENPFLLTGSSDGFDLDNVKVNSVAIPEPATLALMGTGLLCLAVVQRRRRALPRRG
jgi:hypothetical protein